jgi:hypothetical protein
MSEGERQTKRIFCNYCNCDTNHIRRASYLRHRVVEEDGEVHETGDVLTSIWSCAGCDEETFEWLYRPAGDPEHEARYFPTRSKDLGEQIEPKHFMKLDSELSRLYKEVVTCFNRDCLLLCTIGLRALIERVCADKGLEGKLKPKIDGLIKFVPNVNIIQALHDFRFAGNEAAHRLDALNTDDARLAIEIMEDLLNFLYELDYKALKVRSRSGRAAFDSAKPGPVQ